MIDRQPSMDREANDIYKTQPNADGSGGGVATAERAVPAFAGDVRAESDAVTPWEGEAAGAWAFDPQEQDTADTWAAWTEAGRKAWGDATSSSPSPVDGVAAPTVEIERVPATSRADRTVAVASLARHVPVRDMVAAQVGAGLSPLRTPAARERASADRAANDAPVAPAEGGWADPTSPSADSGHPIVVTDGLKREQAGWTASAVGFVPDAGADGRASAPALSDEENAGAPEPGAEAHTSDGVVESDAAADGASATTPTAESADNSFAAGQDVPDRPLPEPGARPLPLEGSFVAVTDEEPVEVLPFLEPEGEPADASADDADGGRDDDKEDAGPTDVEAPLVAVASAPSVTSVAEADDADFQPDDEDPAADDAVFQDEPQDDAPKTADVATASAHHDHDEQDEDEVAPVPAGPVEESYDGQPLAYAADGQPLRLSSSGGIWTIPLLCAGICIIACCLLIPQTDANRRLAYERDRLRLDLESIRQQMATNEEFLRRIHDDPTLAERLAQRQMKTIRAGTQELPLGQSGAQATEGGMSPFQLVAVQPPPAPPPYTPVGGVIANLCYNPRSRLYLMGLGLTFMAAGLVLGDGTRRES